MPKGSAAGVRFFKLSDMEHAEAVCATGVATDFPRHIHTGFCIGVVDRGQRVIFQGGIETLIPEGGLFVINPGVAHTCRSFDRRGHSYRILCIGIEFMKTIASQISEKAGQLPWFPGLSIRDKESSGRFNDFFSLIGEPGSILERESALVNLLSGLILRHSDEPPVPCRVGPQDAAVGRVCEFIEKHCEENLSLGQLASVACLSPFHFQRVFLKARGVSPHDYLLRSKINRACELLGNGCSISDVALQTGFVDQSHFSRNFKRVIGVPPGRYLKLNTTGRGISR